MRVKEQHTQLLDGLNSLYYCPLQTLLINKSDLTVVRQIGEGSFSRVQLCTYKGQHVAVKILSTQTLLSNDPRLALHHVKLELCRLLELQSCPACHSSGRFIF